VKAAATRGRRACPAVALCSGNVAETVVVVNGRVSSCRWRWRDDSTRFCVLLRFTAARFCVTPASACAAVRQITPGGVRLPGDGDILGDAFSAVL